MTITKTWITPIEDWPVRTPEQDLAWRTAEAMTPDNWCQGWWSLNHRFCAVGRAAVLGGRAGSAALEKAFSQYRVTHHFWKRMSIKTINDFDGFEAVQQALYEFANANLEPPKNPLKREALKLWSLLYL